MSNRRRLPLAAIPVLALLPVLVFGAANKKPLTHDVYDRWHSVVGQQISANGKWVLYTLEPQEGDARLIVYDAVNAAYDTIARGTGAKISRNSEFAAFAIKPLFADTKKAKLAKKKPDDMPKDSLGILSLTNKSLVKVARVKSFEFPRRWNGWLVYQLEKELAKPDSLARGRTTASVLDAPGGEPETKDEKGTTLVVRDLRLGMEYTFPFVNEYAISKEGSRVIFASTGNDSTIAAGVFSFNTSSRRLDTLIAGRGVFKSLSFDEQGRQAAFTGFPDTTKKGERTFGLYYWKEEMTAARRIVDTATAGVPPGWKVSENGKTWFSRDGSRLFFGTCPTPAPSDTLLVEEETAKIDVWNWQDDLLQPQQLKKAEEERKRSYLAVCLPGKDTVVQLADLAVPTVVPGDEGNAACALGTSNLPYQRMLSWTGDGIIDAYVIDVRSGARKQILKGVKASPSLSPLGKYVAWYDTRGKLWRSYSVEKDSVVDLSRNIPTPLYNEEFDMPDDPSAHGAMGWTEGDRRFLLYDRYDIWSTDPLGTAMPSMLTAGAGRRQATTYRYLRLNPEERFIPYGRDLLLKAFRTDDKSAGYFSTQLESTTPPTQKIMMPKDFSAPLLARDTNLVVFTRTSFRESPDLYFSTLSFDSVCRISNVNPQQEDYLWGTVELIHWIGTDGKKLDGLLYKPDDFDSTRKYPMIVYFYERNSDLLHRYFSPAPSASTINPALYVSQGYVVFIPDIKYTVGYPGRSAMNAIIPGVRKLIRMGIADESRIGIQGQSWGGYQVAYMVSRTTMFRAAMAGAAVSNMTSAYGGIRWESGMSRMFQYEHSQSRIGATLWQNPQLYIENSPLFRANKIETPLLMMNNDNDGAVPWYQGIELFTALRRLNKPVWMLNYNGEEHNLVQRKNRKDLSVRMLQFFDHYLKGKPEPDWMKSGIPATRKGRTMGYELSAN